MSANAVNQHVIQRFIVVYGAPTTEDTKAYFAEYQRLLGGADPDILKDAVDLVIKQHTFRNWPTIGECIAAVNTVALQRSREKERANDVAEQMKPRQTPTKESRARIAALVGDTTAILKTMNPIPRVEPFDWSRTSKPAWEKRMQESPTARWMSLPQDTRDDILGVKPKR